MELQETLEKIPVSTIKKIIDDPEKSAKAVNLLYVNDFEPGITRLKKRTGFIFIENEKEVTDEKKLARIKSLVLPPNWENVWICSKENGHLQATGYDVKKRKQYRYHSSWNALRSQTKFFRMRLFGNVLPSIRKQLEKDLAKPGLPLEKILAAIVTLMERTHIRVGNGLYEKLYGSFGLTTLKNKHVAVSGTKIEFSFKGKKGVSHKISLKSRRLSRIISQCREIPGKELFQYIDEEGNRHSVDSGMVNEYIGTISGEHFTAKDFRTWAGTVHAFLELQKKGIEPTSTVAKKNIVDALDAVARNLGNTRTVCKKYYVHPGVLSLYENQELEKYFKAIEKKKLGDYKNGLAEEEKIILKILEKN